MAASNHHRTICIQLKGCKIHHGCGDATYINDMDTTLLYTTRKRRRKFHAGIASITPYRDAVLPTCGSFGANGVAYAFDYLWGERLTNDTANVVGLEYFFR